MNSTPSLVTRFARNTRVLRSEQPLSEDQMQMTAPSIFAAGKHASRSERYAYIPTVNVLRSLRLEGFEPYMVAQGASRIEGKAEFTKHLVRLRHANQVQTRPEVNEIILINSHDGASSYQMLAGQFRRICCNGLIVGDVVDDVRIAHKGNAQGDVIDGAFRILDEFEEVEAHTEAMKGLRLDRCEQIAFATAALALRFGDRTIEEGGGHRPAPVTAAQLLEARRLEDIGNDLWAVFQIVSENVLRGGQIGRGPSGRRLHTRPVNGLDRNVALNRAMWMLAEEMRKLKR